MKESVSMSEQLKKNNQKTKCNHKQIAAIVGLALLGLMYLTFFIVALIADELPQGLFITCLFATIFIPILIWVYIWLYGVITNRHTIASLDILQTGDLARTPEPDPECSFDTAEGSDSAE